MRGRISLIPCQVILIIRSANTGERKQFKYRIPGVHVRILFNLFGTKSVRNLRKTRNVRQNPFYWNFKNCIQIDILLASYEPCKDAFKNGEPKRSSPLIIDGLRRGNSFKKGYHDHLE